MDSHRHHRMTERCPDAFKWQLINLQQMETEMGAEIAMPGRQAGLEPVWRSETEATQLKDNRNKYGYRSSSSSDLIYQLGFQGGR